MTTKKKRKIAPRVVIFLFIFSFCYYLAYFLVKNNGNVSIRLFPSIAQATAVACNMNREQWFRVVSDALYETRGIFFFSGKETWGGNIPLVLHILRFLCPLSLATWIASMLSFLMRRVFARVRSHCRKIRLSRLEIGHDSVAVYGTGELAQRVADGNHFIYAGNSFLKGAVNHVILMDTDSESLAFYRAHESELSRKKVIIGLEQIPTYLMKGAQNVSFFNYSEEIARDYWKKHNPREEVLRRSEYHIVILGYRRHKLGYSLLKFGVERNLFAREQAIRYDVFCDPEEEGLGFEQLEMMNADSIAWHTQSWPSCREIIAQADRVILCQAVNPEMLNLLIPMCTCQQIHYYDPNNTSLPGEYSYPYLSAFGKIQEILDEDALLKDRLHRSAMNRHYEYCRLFGTEAERRSIAEANTERKQERLREAIWNGLDGFLKTSNIVVADYYEDNPVPKNLTPGELDERAELEHIRWCRLHFLCGWRYGEPENGKNKDVQKRIHRDLIPWENIPAAEKQKDYQQVQAESGKQLEYAR